MPNTSTRTTTSAWRLQDAKAQFSELVDNAMRGVPQHVTRRGKQAVVVLSEADFEALQRSAANRTQKPTGLIEHLLAMPKAHTRSRVNKRVDAVLDTSTLELQPREIDFS